MGWPGASGPPSGPPFSLAEAGGRQRPLQWHGHWEQSALPSRADFPSGPAPPFLLLFLLRFLHLSSSSSVRAAVTWSTLQSRWPPGGRGAWEGRAECTGFFKERVFWAGAELTRLRGCSYSGAMQQGTLGATIGPEV